MNTIKLMSAVAISAVLAARAAALAPATPMMPGEWETKATINAVAAAGPMAFVAKMMRGKTTTVKSCLTAADVARGPQDMLKQNKSCTFTHYAMVGDKVNAEMVCQQGRETTTVVTSGTFTPTSYSGTSQLTTSGESGMRISSSSVGRLIGPCR